MTAPEPLLPAPQERSTRYGQLRDRVLRDPDWGRAVRWLARSSSPRWPRCCAW
ncbi:hypothetical protein [Microbacterium sp. Se63.02b]|uniref:hypothetical protein n=1 Tax=Microbacterium sp. Se63.02b TaxID=2709304 RepID=UPI001FCED1C0|nr:hypothetical protein [Microbacterium sp. Se63.02b]